MSKTSRAASTSASATTAGSAAAANSSAMRNPGDNARTGGFTPRDVLRANARRKIEDGAVTETYKGDRKTLIAQLNDALATEYVCVLRYYRHYFMASGMLADAVKAEFLEHAQQEQAHAHRLAERIVQLGGEPDLNPDTLTARAHAEYREGRNLRDMVKENLIAERIAIDSYRELIAYIGDDDPTTRRLIEDILAQEEEHADEFADLLEGWIGE